MIRKPAAEYNVGDRVILDGKVPAIVTATSVYVGRSNCRREIGVSVRPDEGYGLTTRARVVALYRIKHV